MKTKNIMINFFWMLRKIFECLSDHSITFHGPFSFKGVYFNDLFDYFIIFGKGCFIFLINSLNFIDFVHFS